MQTHAVTSSRMQTHARNTKTTNHHFLDDSRLAIISITSQEELNPPVGQHPQVGVGQVLELAQHPLQSEVLHASGSENPSQAVVDCEGLCCELCWCLLSIGG